jgi:signal transduction histidine kinase
MLNRIVDTAARARWVLPIVLLVAGVAMAINEITYQHATATLSRGITLTDARINATRTLQLMTDAEAAVRGYLLTGHPDRLARWELSRKDLPEVQALAVRLSTEVAPAVADRLDALLGALQQRISVLAEWVAMAQQGQRGEALSRAAQELPGQPLSALRAEFDAILAQAASAQQVTRVSLYGAMQISRVAVHALVILSALWLALFVRQLRASDTERAQEKVRLAEQVHIRTAELRELAGHLVTAREDERARVARELHDEMGGLFTAMKLEFARLRRVNGLPTMALERLQSIEARLNDGIALKRRIIEHLRPSSLDQLGLRAALQLLCDDIAHEGGFVVETALEDAPLCKDSELTLFRLVQESLTNIVKYARARQVWVRLDARAGHARLEVEDDGVGFDPSLPRPGHHGLTGMHMRVESHHGKLVIDSRPGQGTRIRADLPLQLAEA